MKVFIFLIFITTNSQAFTLNTSNASSFSNKKVKIYITSNSNCSQTGLSRDEILDQAIIGAKKFWNKVSTSNFKFIRGGVFNTTDTKYLTEKLCASDSTNTCDPNTTVPTGSDIIIACNTDTISNFTSGNIYAKSGPTKISNKTIKGSVILINDSGNSALSTLSRSEWQSLLAHELGHAIGIGHSTKDYALMYYKNQEHMDRLSSDDTNAITYLYPNKLDGCAPLFGGTINMNKRQNKDFYFMLSLIFGLIIGLSFYSLVKKTRTIFST